MLVLPTKLYTNFFFLIPCLAFSRGSLYFVTIVCKPQKENRVD